MTNDAMPSSYTCAACKKQHDYPAYVFAHWNESITHTCDCGAKSRILRGHAFPIGRPRVGRAAKAAKA